MQPIRAFETAVAARTQATVAQFAGRGHALVLVIGALALALIGVALGTHLLVNRRVLASIRMVTGELADLARGQFQMTRRLQARGHDEVAGLAAACNAVLDKLAALVRDVREEAAGVLGRSADMGEQLAALQDSVEHQEASTHSTNAAAREIAATSGALRGSTRAMADAAEKTRSVVTEGETGLLRLSANMAALLEANRQIVAKLSLISDKASQVTVMADVIRRVAEQTDLLSLNAAIEAEKAGEYGRGFGVVAREIRRLADQSEAAIEDIEAVVRDVRGAIGSGVMEMDTFCGRLVDSVTAAQRIQGQLGEMIQDVQKLLPLLEELDASFRGQDEGVHQIRDDMQQLSHQVEATVETLKRAQRNRSEVEAAGRRLRELVDHMIAMG